jgi:rod shape determining protein RodA
MATRVAQPSPRAEFTSEVGALLRHVDYLLLAATGALVAFGLWVLESVTRSDVPGDADYYVARQSIYVAVGAFLLVVAAAVNPDVYRRFRTPLFVVAILLILLVVPLGTEIRGSKRWIELGFFNFQPSELGKIALIVFLAGLLADRGRRVEWRTTLAVVGLAAIPVLLVFEQPDFGTALVYCAATAGVLFLGGAPWRHLAVLAVLLGLVAAAVLWLLPSSGIEVLEPYQRDRLIGFVHPDADPTGTTYNVNQSITAVGSGGLDGRGVANATQTKFNYLPEHNTDFIFSSLAEQRGFLGAAALLLLYAVVVWRGIKIIAVAPSLFTATVAGTIVLALLCQVFINIGMTIGIAPITGIPLPLVSYGGSSMITTLVMVGILEAIHVHGRLASRR